MTLIDKAEALLPCPFCGGEAELWNAHDNRPAWIACMGRCAVLISKEHATDAEAITAWNRRALPARGVRDEQAFMGAVWDALKADASDLGKQQRILVAFRAALSATTEAPHVNETPKSEHDGADVLTDAAQAREAALHIENAKRLRRYDWQEWTAQDVEDAEGIICAYLALIGEEKPAQAREEALMEAHKAILAMDTKKDEDLTYNLAVLRAAEKVRRLISEART